MTNAWLYMMTNQPNGVLYTGATTDIIRRVWQHREGSVEGFTKRYELKRLVYLEPYPEIAAAIQRERNIEDWPRKWKVRLILAANPAWEDFYEQLL